MPDLPLETPKILALYLQMAQYPVLALRKRLNGDRWAGLSGLTYSNNRTRVK